MAQSKYGKAVLFLAQPSEPHVGSKFQECAAIQNSAGKFVTIAPKAAADAKPELPMIPYSQRA